MAVRREDRWGLARFRRRRRPVDRPNLPGGAAFTRVAARLTSVCLTSRSLSVAHGAIDWRIHRARTALNRSIRSSVGEVATTALKREGREESQREVPNSHVIGADRITRTRSEPAFRHRHAALCFGFLGWAKSSSEGVVNHKTSNPSNSVCEPRCALL